MKFSLTLFAATALMAALHLPAQAADAAAGAKVFAKCKVCHTAAKGAPHKMGPNLYGVVGRGAAADATFKYSPAFVAVKGKKTWTDAELDAYLTSPKAAVPGTKMIFAGLPNKVDRDNLIEWLKAQK